MPYFTAAEEIRSLITEYGKATTLWIDTEVADYKTPNPRLSLIQVLDHPEDMTGNSVYLLDVLDKSDVIADFVERIMTNDALCTGQKIEKKLAMGTEKGFHRKLPHNQRNPYEPD